MLAHLFNGKKPSIPCSFIKNSFESDVVLVLGWTIEMYFNGGTYAPSIVIGRDGHCVVKMPNFSAFHIKMHCSISVLLHSEKLTLKQAHSESQSAAHIGSSFTVGFTVL